jgi:hypothetical protein
MSHSQDPSKLDYSAAGFCAPIPAVIECALGWAATARKDGHQAAAVDYEDQHRRAVALSLETSVSATPLPAPRAAPTAASPPSQDETDAGWADIVAKTNAGYGRAPAPKESPPAGARQRQSEAEIDAIYAAIAATLNKEAGAKPRKAVRG